MSAEAYRRLTYDLTLAVARQLLPGNPRMVFEYISGEGTDANSVQKWARVKAETEAAIFEIGFRDAYALPPASSSRCAAPPAACDRFAGCTPDGTDLPFSSKT